MHTTHCPHGQCQPCPMSTPVGVAISEAICARLACSSGQLTLGLDFVVGFQTSNVTIKNMLVHLHMIHVNIIQLQRLLPGLARLAHGIANGRVWLPHPSCKWRLLACYPRLLHVGNKLLLSRPAACSLQLVTDIRRGAFRGLHGAECSQISVE